MNSALRSWVAWGETRFLQALAFMPPKVGVLGILWLGLCRKVLLCPGIFAPCANSMRSTKEDRAVLGLSRWVKFDPTGTRHPWKSPPDNAADWHVVLAGSMASGPRRPERTPRGPIQFGLVPSQQPLTLALQRISSAVPLGHLTSALFTGLNVELRSEKFGRRGEPAFSRRLRSGRERFGASPRNTLVAARPRDGELAFRASAGGYAVTP